MTGRRDPDRLYEEVAFVAYHFNWSHETVLELPHGERTRWCAEISRINERMNDTPNTDRRPGASGLTELADLADLADVRSGPTSALSDRARPASRLGERAGPSNGLGERPVTDADRREGSEEREP